MGVEERGFQRVRLSLLASHFLLVLGILDPGFRSRWSPQRRRQDLRAWTVALGIPTLVDPRDLAGLGTRAPTVQIYRSLRTLRPDQGRSLR